MFVVLQFFIKFGEVWIFVQLRIKIKYEKGELFKLRKGGGGWGGKFLKNQFEVERSCRVKFFKSKFFVSELMNRFVVSLRMKILKVCNYDFDLLEDLVDYSICLFDYRVGLIYSQVKLLLYFVRKQDRKGDICLLKIFMVIVCMYMYR